MAADLSGGKKGAGLLRARPNVHWRKDCGREPLCEQEWFPRLWRAGEFTGERVNDVHFPVPDKREARMQAEAGQR